MLSLLFLSCLPFFGMVQGKSEKDTDALIHIILREQGSMIKHCMSSVCTRNMYNPHRPVKPWDKRMVAFSAYPESNIEYTSAKTKIVFGKTRTNIGNAYDPTTGVFTAPIAGVYVFHWTIMIPSGKHSDISIQVNGKSQVVLYGNARSYPNTVWYSPSQSYVADLRKGDTVNLLSDGSGGYVHRISTFTGYRL